jgi:signal transduction histidine kinase/CheY-like chemotaxis protein
MGVRHRSRATPVQRLKRVAIALVLTASIAAAIVWWLAGAARSAEEQAARSLATATQALAAAIDAPFARFAELTEGYRPADAASADRLGMTVRQIRLQGALPYVTTTFLANRTGQVVAASVPVPPAEADVWQAKWFQHAAAQPAGILALQHVDPAWLRAGETVVLTRNVTDESGRSAGLLGAIFRLDDIRLLVRPGWMAPAIATSLVAQDGATLLAPDPAPDPAPTPPEAAVPGADLLPRLMLAIDRLSGRPATLAAAAEVPSIRATVQTSLATDAVLRAAWSGPAAARPGFVLLGGLGLCLLLAAIPAGRRPDAAADEPDSGAAAAELAALREQLAAAASDRDRVLAAVGHDVRTPMNSILGICALLLEEGNLAPDQHVWIGRIEASCEALLAMLNGLLEIASGAGNAGLRPAEVDVAALVDEVAGVLAPQAHDKGLRIGTRFDDAVHGHWMADPTRLRQVLFNLASNAIKYTAAGTVEIRASAVTDADGRTAIRLVVSDTGCGIAREDRSRIFERFMRGGGDAADGREGLGLGLALCRENAALMGGSLTLDSTVGVGSEFSFEFLAERPAPGRQSAPYTGRTALVVGFDAAQARRLAGHLERIGLAVETAEDGFLAIGLAERMASRSGALDAVVVHGGMTGLPAEAFFARLRSTAYGRRSAIVAVGTPGDGAAMADAVLPPAADGRQVATTVATFLAAMPALECIDPAAPLPGAARVLVVEDDKVNQALLTAALSRRGFTAFVADHGEAAVRLAGSVGFDAILMDLQMPGIDGFEATRRIRAMGGRMARMPIIALTALTGAEVERRCAAEGFTARIVKPVNLDHLAAELWRWIETCRSAADGEAAASAPANAIAEVSAGSLECMVADIGLERTQACVREFVADVGARCRRLGELLPGWEADAILRICRDIHGRAAELGALGLAGALEDLAERVIGGDRQGAETLAGRIEAAVTLVGAAMVACLGRLGRDDREAA